MIIDHEKINKIGIDRVSFDVDASVVDFSNYEYEYDDLLKTKSIDISEYINDSEFVYRLYNKKKYRKSILCLDIVFPRLYHQEKHNIYNCSMTDVKDAIKCILCTIESQGIVIPEKALKCVYLEINKTIEVSDQLIQYKDSLEYLFNNKVCSDTRDPNSMTVTASTSRRKLQFYDKTADVMNKLNIRIDENLCRFEIKYNRSEGIYNSFKTNYLQDITQDAIEKVYLECLEKLQKNLFKHIKEDAEYLYMYLKKKNVKGVKSLDKTYKKYSSENKDQTVFFEVLYVAVKKLYKESNNSNYNRDIRKCAGEDNIYFFRKLEKLLFLLQNFSKTEDREEAEKHVQKLIFQQFQLDIKKL